jgi:hypothetical protein
MLKTLFFSLLLHLGWPDGQDWWVQRADPHELVETVSRTTPPKITGAPRKMQIRFPGRLWRQAAAAHGVDPVLLYSVALLESGKKGGRNKVGPWPFALHFNEAGVWIYAATAKEARFVLAHVSTDNVDIGLGQVNYKSHKDKVSRPEDLLDPGTNLRVAGQILAEAQRSTPDPELGVGRYNSWQDSKARFYGRRVLRLYKVIYEAVKGG